MKRQRVQNFFLVMSLLLVTIPMVTQPSQQEVIISPLTIGESGNASTYSHPSVVADLSSTLTSTTSDVLYFNDFEGAVGLEWSSTLTDTTPVGARRFLGQFGSETVSLTLNDLPAHTRITVSFELFIVRSWDGNTASVGPDIWDLSGGKVASPLADVYGRILLIPNLDKPEPKRLPLT